MECFIIEVTTGTVVLSYKIVYYPAFEPNLHSMETFFSIECTMDAMSNEIDIATI